MELISLVLQSKISRYYVQKTAEIATFAFVVALGIYLLGDDGATDVLHTTIFIGLGIYFYKDKNLLTILLIIGLARLFPQFAIDLDLGPENGLTKCAIYATASYVSYKLRYDNMAKFSLSLILCMVLAEAYWWLTHYEKPPAIAYSATVLVNDMLVRHFIFARTYCFGAWSKDQKKLQIDWQLHFLMGLFIFLVFPLVFEYFIRHILDVQILAFYNVYSELVHLINVIILWIILNYALKKTALFQA